MLETNDRIKELLDTKVIKYPNLHKYITNFIKNNGESEDPEYLPKLLVWIRRTTDDRPVDFHMDDETYEEFCCWGHNSRWKNVFWNYMIDNLEYVIEVCLELAKRNGDCEIEYSKEDD